MSKKKKNPSEASEKSKIAAPEHIHSIEQSYRGPIPPAAEFERYNNTLPGAADRILRMSESQQAYDHRIAGREQWLYHLSKLFAHVIVLIVFLFSIAAGTYLVIHGHNTTGLVVLISVLTTFATAIIFGGRKSSS